MGKSRKHIAYLSVSCSGPAHGTTERIRGTKYRTRDGADLKYTTADCDWFYSHVKREEYVKGLETKHYRLVNPTSNEFADALEDAISFLANFSDRADWDGGSIVLLYAGHGMNTTGDLVFANNSLPLDAQDFIAFIAERIPKSEHRLRIDALVDSCHSGGFLAKLLWASHNHYSDKIFPCTLMGASLPDEAALESDRIRHGVFTFAYMEEYKIPSLAQPSWKLIPKLCWYKFRKRDLRRLFSGGVSFLTRNRQNSVEYENGHMEVHGKGAFDIKSDSYELKEILGALVKARSMNSGEKFSM